MRVVVITGPGTVEVTTVDDPTPAPDEVVVEVAATGICGTDLHILAGEHGTLPVIPGHEVSGIVVATGGPEGPVRVGDRVAIDPSLPCGRCVQCRRGRENLCPDLGALGVTVAGGAAELLAAPARRCVVLPEHVDLHGAALIEPLSCAVHAHDVLGSAIGSTVLIYGAGTMGLLMLCLAAGGGAGAVDVVDVAAGRLPRSLELGASRAAVDANELDRGEWDVVIDATGNVAAIRDGLDRVAPGGTFLQLGVTRPDARVDISPYDVYRREITIAGSMAILHSFERAARLFASGIVDWRAIVTHQAALDDYEAALRGFARGEGVKTQVVPGR